jgi:beta-galactosidase GanA
MEPIWKQVKTLHFNTLLTPLSWELIEPKEGSFDFALVDSLIVRARQENLHLVFLWLASWKNGMSSYMPSWVKENYKKYPRVKIGNGQTMEVLSTLSAANVMADAKAFAALMKHIRNFDGTIHTVLMMQVENEVGILGDSRDRSEGADEAYASVVPKELIDYLVKNKDNLVPEVKMQWEQNGAKTSGSWETVFGKGKNCDELFMAWNYSGYVNKVAAAGKKEYPIPMYANAWLDQGVDPKPGDYPSGGPLARVMDIWKARATAIDLFGPDLYVAEYEERCRKFTQRGNPLFIPEMNSGDDGARNIFIAIGKYNAIGVSPFGIDHIRDAGTSGFAKSYDALGQLSAMILEEQLKKQIIGFVVDEKAPVVTCEMGGYQLEISLDEIFGHRAKTGYGIVMADGENKFIGAGSGFRVRFHPLNKESKAVIGVTNVDEGEFKEGKWIPGRRLNGDEDDQGRAWRFGSWSVGIEKCTVYTYE